MRVAWLLVLFVAFALPVSAGDWPMFQHDARHTGTYTGPSHIDSYRYFNLLWAYEGEEEISTSPIAVNLKVAATASQRKGLLQLAQATYLERFREQNDSNLELVFGTRQGSMVALTPLGDVAWRYDADGAVSASPAAGDTDRDDFPEVAFATTEGLIYLLEHDGTAKWTYDTRIPLIGASSVIADFDDDGILDIGVGGTILHAAGRRKALTSQELAERGYALLRSGSYTTYADLDADGSYEELRGSRTVIPAVADVVADNRLEIITSSELLLDRVGYLSVYDADRALVWQHEKRIQGPPVVTDFDGDLSKEIAFVSDDDTLYIVDAGNGSILWDYRLGAAATPLAIADLNGDNRSELIVGVGTRLLVFGHKRDSDGDGIGDYEETLMGLDPYNIDSDGDGLIDSVDENPYYFGERDTDSDGDGILDFYEEKLGLDPRNPDSDGDGIIDSLDAEPLVPSATHAFVHTKTVYSVIVVVFILLVYVSLERKKKEPEKDEEWKQKEREKKEYEKKRKKEREEQQQTYSDILEEQYSVLDSRTTKDLLRLIAEKRKVRSRDAAEKLRVSELRLARSAVELQDKGLIQIAGNDPSRPFFVVTEKFWKVLKAAKKEED